MTSIARRPQRVHAHVSLGKIIDGQAFPLAQEKRVLAVGDGRAAEGHAHAPGRFFDVEPMIRADRAGIFRPFGNHGSFAGNGRPHTRAWH